MKVLKFGGSSVASPERIENVIHILKDYFGRGEKFAVVFSAFGGVTDSLIEMCEIAASGDTDFELLVDAFSKRHMDAVKALMNEDNQLDVIRELEMNHQDLRDLLKGVFLVREASLRTRDQVLSYGERNSNYIIAQALKQNGVNAAYLDAREILRTDGTFGSATIDRDKSFENINIYFGHRTEIQVVTGFIASAEDGSTTTLGRGGSDFTASLLGAALKAQHIEIWTDVDGVLTADPRKVKKAFPIPEMTYAEAMEMSHFGAKVIYPPTLQPALQASVPIYIKNTFNPEHKGTYISKAAGKGSPVRGISSMGDIALLTLSGSGMFGVPGTSGRLFGALARAGINIILITQGSSEHAISFAILPERADLAKQVVNEEFQFEMERSVINPIKVEKDLSVVAIVGENMRYYPGIAGKLFQSLGKNGVNVVAIAQGSSELNISVVIPQSDESKALNAMHEAFFLSKTKEIHLFMIGVGLIGGTLIKQIEAHQEFLLKKRNLEVKIIGLSNSKKMLFNEDGIDLSNWKEQLVNADRAANPAVFIDEMIALNMSNTVFVDNTANADVANFYERILDASISVSTPNKIATSSSYLQYKRLKTIAQKRGIQFLYETNVGAGLPVLSTMHDLITSGDEILKIEGVLSGSLSYIFNNFKGGKKFSDIVVKAGELGYTEPDPRIDLNGIDVRRKLIILAREAGLALESEDVEIENILPENVQKAESIADFFAELAKADDYFIQLQSEAAKAGKELRMIAKLTIDNGNSKATIGLQTVDSTNPFYSLSGSDNMIVFTTERYQERPLVVRGPGAGAEVTAAGVFAEIIQIGG